MPELELLQKIDKALNNRYVKLRETAAYTRNNPDSKWQMVIYNDGVAAGGGTMYCEFCALYEELGYTDEPIWAWRKEENAKTDKK